MTAFPDIPVIQYEGKDSDNPLAFRWYNPDEMIEGKSMKDHLRFSIVYWHTMRGMGSDPFGVGTAIRPWEDGTDSVQNAQNRARVAFEIFEKLQAPYYAFHDRDVAPEGSSLAESHANLDAVADVLEEEQNRKIALRICQSTVHTPPAMPMCSPIARAKSKKRWKSPNDLAVRTTAKGTKTFTTRTETRARPFDYAVDYAIQIGFDGQFLIEPKPKEPTKHQYDSDAAACLNFLRAYDLLDYFKLNLETNHATLAGHTMMHELDYAGIQGALGSIDANTGDMLLGWDTDQFGTDYYLTTQTMYYILKHGGLGSGGVNFDAKVRRESHEPVDLFHAHIGSMDAYAKGLKVAAAIRADNALDGFIKTRYSSWDEGIGAKIEAGEVGFAELEQYMLDKGEVDANISGRQEMLENLVNRYLDRV